MKAFDRPIVPLTVLVLLLCTVALLIPALAGAAPGAGPTTARSFCWSPQLTQIAAGGIGNYPDSWQNSYPWSMTRFNGDLYVATGRVGCTSAVMSLMTGPMGGGAGLPLPGGTAPPQITEFLSKDAMSVTDDAKYAAFNDVTRAEIYRYHCGTWERVFHAPMIPSYLQGPGAPYMAAAIGGFRGMTVMTDRNGERAMYAAAGGFSFAAQQPLMMRSTDGVHWTEVYAPQDMGRESRAVFTHHGKIYVGVGYAGLGLPVKAGAWASDEPTNLASWKPVLEFPSLDPTNTNVVSFATYFGRLYVGTENKAGFQVWRSKVTDPAGNADWKRVVSGGAGDPMNGWAGTMKVFNGMLYVGSMSVPGITGAPAPNGFDLIRLTPWDTWQLVVGDPRTIATGTGTKAVTPVSGRPSGFGNPLNLYCWSLAVFNGRLYLGSFDASTFIKVASENGVDLGTMMGLTPEQVQALIAGAGADLYRTWDGRTWTTVTLTGFDDPYCYGFRNLVPGPFTLDMGLSNPFYGCELWRLRSAW